MDVWSLRSDLHFVHVASSDSRNAYWVIKDPLARECHYLSENEKTLIEMADGSAGIIDICRSALLRFPTVGSLQSLISFFLQARRRGLLVADAAGPLDATLRRTPSPKRSWRDVSRLMAIRLPGWNPSPLLDATVPYFQCLGSRAMQFCLLALFVGAGFLILGRFDQLMAESVGLFSRGPATWWLMTWVVIAAVKTVHELAHAITCRMVGAECRQIGVLVLFGAPCLYCDVTDLWAVPHRAKRVLVSAAGMLAELFLAAMATIVWATTGDTDLHSLALIVMVVCSISTLVVNANPLLR
ncbi:MAG: hypothetical protein AAFX06_33465, partial [Planctomycetota bacterium]